MGFHLEIRNLTSPQKHLERKNILFPTIMFILKNVNLVLIIHFNQIFINGYQRSHINIIANDSMINLEFGKFTKMLLRHPSSF